MSWHRHDWAAQEAVPIHVWGHGGALVEEHTLIVYECLRCSKVKFKIRPGSVEIEDLS